MIWIISKNLSFETRKQAKHYLGTAYFNALLKTKDILFINNHNHIAINGKADQNNKRDKGTLE